MAIALKKTRSYTPEDGRLKGKSKFWGFPDMPADMEFPYKDGDPMCFICQINLEELHAQTADATDLNLLPRRGMLYFFAQIDYFLGWSRELEEGIGLWGKDDADGHKLLGRPFFNEVPAGTSLLQIDEDDDWGLRFFDSGMINFIMDSNSLAHKDFSKTELYFHKSVK